MYAAQHIRIYKRFLNPTDEIAPRTLFLTDNKRIKQKMQNRAEEIKYYRKVTKELRKRYKKSEKVTELLLALARRLKYNVIA